MRTFLEKTFSLITPEGLAHPLVEFNITINTQDVDTVNLYIRKLNVFNDDLLQRRLELEHCINPSIDKFQRAYDLSLDDYLNLRHNFALTVKALDISVELPITSPSVPTNAAELFKDLGKDL